MIFFELAVRSASCSIEPLPKTMLTGLQNVKLFICGASFGKKILSVEIGCERFFCGPQPCGALYWLGEKKQVKDRYGIWAVIKTRDYITMRVAVVRFGTETAVGRKERYNRLFLVGSV